ncbi:MAG TPA: hypothetical protein ACFYEK_06405 [Candidatus Wunengus sp. YC60]|uniref:hypothetical protein n=1 Tax=Candidatus Wunengus sp. YC60 TaxID=3367697 RepID=UPI004028B2D2
MFFVIFLIVLDLLLVRWLKLSKVAWKKTEYVWLGFATLGLIGMAIDAKTLLSRNLLQQHVERQYGMYVSVRQDIEFGTGAAICRKFIRSEYSPADLEEIQREYDFACTWFRERLVQLPHDPRPEFPDLVIDIASAMSKVTDEMLLEYFHLLSRDIENYKIGLDILQTLQRGANPEGSKDALIIFSPMLLAFALALRITKVTGEIKLET